MKNLIFFVSCVLCIMSCVLTVNAQTNSCPNGFRCGNTLVDPRDGNSYPTVQIGTQCWMAKNLQTTKFLNGNAIPQDSGSWSNPGLVTPAYTFYTNNSLIYGAYYNWYAVTDSRGLCPRGWYMPTANEFWGILVGYLGGQNSAGPKLEQGGSTGFNALYGGGFYNAAFLNVGTYAEFWAMDYYATVFQVYGSNTYLYEAGLNINFGYSARCVRGNN